ncbi:hypothetical protein D3C78_1575070 [compost metagenome]
MISAAKRFPDFGQGIIRQLPRQVHGYLARIRHSLCPFPRFEIFQAQTVKFTYFGLNVINRDHSRTAGWNDVLKRLRCQMGSNVGIH